MGTGISTLTPTIPTSIPYWNSRAVLNRRRELELDARGRLRQHAGDVPVWTLPLLDHDVDAPSLQALTEQSLG